MMHTYSTTQIVAEDAALPAEPAQALASMGLLADLIGSHPQVNAHRRSAPMRIPGGYVVSLSSALAPALATRRVRALIASSTDQADLFTVRSH